MKTTRRQMLGMAAGGMATAGAGYALGGAMAGGPRLLHYSTRPRADYVQTLDTPPARADAVIIGGGIAGLCSAMFLKRRGLDVVVLEKGYVAGEQSSRNYGWIVSNAWHPDKVPMANRGKAIWQGLAAGLNRDLLFRQTGNFTLIRNDEERADWEAWIAQARARDAASDARIIDRRELEGMIPNLPASYRHALYQASDGTIEPPHTAPALAEALIAAGVRIVAPCAARMVETTGGAISHVVTEKGAIRTPLAIVAGGAWSGLFLGNLGVDCPELAVVNTSLQRVAVESGPPAAGIAADYSWKRNAAGDYTLLSNQFNGIVTADSLRQLPDFWMAFRETPFPVRLKIGNDFFASLNIARHWKADERSPFETMRVMTADYSDKALDEILRVVARDFPAFARARVQERWGGVIDASPDAMPVISQVPGRPGLLLCCLSGSGMTMGPAAGEMIAAMATGGKQVLDTSPYRLSRFRDGSALSLKA